ncbi:hypothetical protein DB032_19470 [Chromobacterium sp. Panama]|uniref:mechanosensitive ion channel domain-containing protein n=1 Tax=Chromobacterium sp. Panama TaxID=2161826 RepID=UPI000D3153F5|nr:hypothetical protein DB032_19470 [Chromobacterium sp. Panama]
MNGSRVAERRVDITLSVPAYEDVDAVKKKLSAIMVSDQRTLMYRDVFVRLLESRESGLKFTTRLWTRNEDYWNVYYDLVSKFKMALTE